jgi:DNA-binding Lrp family transcriptional regulator
MAKNKPKRELAEEVDLLDTKLSSLVEILEERGILTQKEWETTINKNIVIK